MMQRTILALFVEEPSNPIETTGMDGVGVEVESVQETFGGHTIYTGQAATVSSYEVTPRRGDTEEKSVDLRSIKNEYDICLSNLRKRHRHDRTE